MILIVGLGNPGEKYKNTRHNVGFMTIDNLQLTTDKFLDWKNIKKLQAEISKGEINGQKVLLVKPRTFMNNSGQAVKLLIREFLHQKRKINTMGVILRQLKDFWVVHDDIDLPLGKIKIVKNRGAAGHKGVQSVIDELNTKNFVRFRIGILPKSGKPKNVEKPSTGAKLGTGLVPHRNKVSGAGFILQKFKKEEEKIVKEVIKKTVEAIEMTLKEGIEKAMNRYNK